jgi:hypothetical protein
MLHSSIDMVLAMPRICGYADPVEITPQQNSRPVVPCMIQFFLYQLSTMCYFFGRQGVRGRQKINCLGLWRSKTIFLEGVGGRKVDR